MIDQARERELMEKRTINLDLTREELALLESLACDEGLSLGQLMTKFGLDIITAYRKSEEARE